MGLTDPFKRKQRLLMNAIIHLIRFGRDLDAEADKKLLAMRGIVRQDSIKNVDLTLVVESLVISDRNEKLSSPNERMATGSHGRD